MSDNIITTVAEPANEAELLEIDDQMVIAELDDFQEFILVPYACEAIVDGTEELTPTQLGENDECFAFYSVVGKYRRTQGTEVIADVYHKDAGDLLVMALNTFVREGRK